MRITYIGTMFALVAILGGCDSYKTTAIPHSAPIPEGLWTASGIPSAILRLSPAQLSDTGARIPATILTTPSARLFTLAGVAFDQTGTMWIASADDSLVLAFAPTALANSGSSPAQVVIEPIDGSLSRPSSIAFDREHRLWVANNYSGTLVRFDPAQLAAGGPQRPAVAITGLGHPTAIAFDAGGTLWVSDNTDHTIAGFSPAQLAVSGKPDPSVVLSSSEGSLLNPSGLAFDAAGNLWVANITGNNVASFSPAQLTASGAPAPRTVLFPTVTRLDLPVGLAFDAAGSLWVVGAAGSLTKFDRASLDARGAEPSARIALPAHSLLWSAAFWPKPGGLPLN